MDGAAALLQEMALAYFWLAKPQEVLEAYDITAFKLFGGEFHVCRCPLQIVLGEIDIAGDVTALSAAGLADESNALH